MLHTIDDLCMFVNADGGPNCHSVSVKYIEHRLVYTLRWCAGEDRCTAVGSDGMLKGRELL